ncbi:GGDEF domain-containing protein [Shewanella carassii]|uniref:Diguanylate cyclase n=1 Tax=Shewanella carassii TaxID=1987584 RepID=A0ABQ1SW90_9GAMM|nr:GGDEF domain-containing protein [Shewanella carassii]BCV66786.1 diguanylate cyclase [Shewanella carassii]GGE64297.1 diguanylate cyclase [Shewanella carassii]
MKLSSRLMILVSLCIVLTLVLALSLLQQRHFSQQTFDQMHKLVRLQLHLDQLRSNLWLLQQYGDIQAVENTQRDLQRLNALLNVTQVDDKHQQQLLANLKRQSEHINTLLDHSLPKLPRIAETPLVSSMLQSRYNMSIQSMSEDLFRFQHYTMDKARQLQLSHLYLNGALLLAIALLVTGFTLHTLRRFRLHLASLKRGIRDLARGDLHSRIQLEQQDELSELANEFNNMKQALMETTERKEQLQLEVEAQTRQLQLQQDRLRYLADHDDLTGALNRGAATTELEHAIVRCQRQQLKAALLFIDLDKFKPINDSFGHSAGDAVLVEIAKRMRNTLRRSDLVARIGGDEFIIWLEPINSREEVCAVLEKIHALGTDISWQGQRLEVGLSTGISLYPEHGDTLAELISAADNAMYQAKESQAATGPQAKQRYSFAKPSSQS